MAESSSAARKRPRARPMRQITYRADEILPTDQDEPIAEEEYCIADHTLLQFAEGSPEFVTCKKIVDTETLQHRTFDWDLLDTLGSTERMETLLRGPWRDALTCGWPQFDELTLEFHSTFRQTSWSWTDDRAVSFSLGRQTHTMTIARFAVLTGFYTEEEVTQHAFLHSLRGIVREPEQLGVTEAQLAEFWMSIADSAYSTSVVESSIRDPFLRYLHRILACTIIGRKAGAEKCNQLDLFCLYCIVGQRPANIATILLASLSRVRRGGPTARIALGPYIYRIARRLRVFDRYPERSLRLGQATDIFDADLMRAARMIEVDEPRRWVPVREFVQVPPPADAPAMAAMQRGAPLHRQHILFRGERPQPVHPLRQPRPERITLEAIWERMDRQDEARVRSDRALRLLLTHQGVPIPDWFAEPATDEAAEDVGGGD